MKYSVLAGALGALLLGACATTADQANYAENTAAPTQTAEATDVDMSEVVCRKEKTTGTRFARKICKTRQQWEDDAKNVGDPLSNSQRRSLQFSPENG
ncbi:hypothetical protein [Hyphococcus luteus]|uniref:Lipoprotein n=1 Tax=Hyphococcus luteus TaxID=2058213 RepID=A0A2S7K9G6_9PROT|nr:hypothetical protein [Marinicaulis flavus]PQA89128.1 hypothetical protein CW354_04060 [Marinicaulis flavus]